MGALKKLKKHKKTDKVVIPFNQKFADSLHYDRGFNEGAATQRKTDIESLVNLLEGLEEWPGIGEITAAKIRQHFLAKFGQ